MGKFVFAIARYTNANELDDDDDADCLDLIELGYVALHDNEIALKYLKQAVDIDPNNERCQGNFQVVPGNPRICMMQLYVIVKQLELIQKAKKRDSDGY